MDEKCFLNDEHNWAYGYYGYILYMIYMSFARYHFVFIIYFDSFIDFTIIYDIFL
jgi:hypothetical protein